MTPGLVLFDIDGTLVSTAGAGRLALDRAFEQLFGIRRAFESIELAGRTDLLIVRDALRRGAEFVDPRVEAADWLAGAHESNLEQARGR